jgi:hypothetical protein
MWRLGSPTKKYPFQKSFEGAGRNVRQDTLLCQRGDALLTPLWHFNALSVCYFAFSPVSQILTIIAILSVLDALSLHALILNTPTCFDTLTARTHSEYSHLF